MKKDITDEKIWERFRERTLDLDVEKAITEGKVTLREFFAGRIPHAVKVRHKFWRALKDAGWSYNAIAQLFFVDHASVTKALLK